MFYELNFGKLIQIRVGTLSYLFGCFRSGFVGGMNEDQSDLINVFFQTDDGIRDSIASRGLGDMYKGQGRDYFYF